ncbi:META domain-containing protein [Methanococcoides alaskense]|uniref:Heat shock protein HslJ n=1 Tax=Methanococcoides alaskense TaxID=325778 RepID=A0AA90Z8E3_9EURY|nr:META domain-containing protein [Methanococcoides alaskense]MDA0524461.1 META domain-containing protein [Methanococcoides alaskense]MDR6223280.1 heat shock protein HslJ [Methanococcoides alaskense]
MNTQKLLSIFIIFAVLTCTFMAVGCTEIDNEDDIIEAEQDEEIVASPDEIIDIEWQWSGLTETFPASQSVVPDPENYKITLRSDGTYSIKADCNIGSGGYTMEGNELTLAPGPITLAYCGPDSLDSQYLSLLSNVTTVSMEDDQLVLGIGDNGDRMLFVKGDVAEQ